MPPVIRGNLAGREQIWRPGTFQLGRKLDEEPQEDLPGEALGG